MRRSSRPKRLSFALLVSIVALGVSVLARPAFAITRTLTITHIGEGFHEVDPLQATYEDGEIVNLRAIPDEPYSFIGWEGTFTSPDAWIDLLMDRDHVLVARFERRFTLTVEAANGVSVQVSPVKPYYGPGEIVTLTAYDGGGYRFAGWGGTAEGGANPLVLAMDQNHQILAYASLNREPMYVTIVGEGTVTRDPDFAEYLPGTRVELVAHHAEGWRFAGWTGRVVSPDSVIVVEIVGTTRLTATFEPDVFPLSVEVIGSGSVTRTPDLPAYPPGTEVVLVAAAAPGWHFVYWDIGGVIIDNPVTSVDVIAPTSVSATFAQAFYSLTLEEQGPGYLDVQPALDLYPEGSEVTLTASDMDGNTFLGWGGAASGSANPLTVVMDGDKSISATWAVTRHALDVLIVGGGEVLREPDWPSYPGGVFVELTPVPSTGFAFSHWSGAETSSANPLVWEVIGNAGFTATFVPTAAVGGSADLRPGLAPVVPNPARGQISLAFTLPGASRARLTVLDVAGRVIDVIADGQFEQGTHRASWKTSEVARARGAGLYFVCLEAGALREVRRVAVTR